MSVPGDLLIPSFLQGLGGPGDQPAALHLDHRNEAIVVCDWWARALGDLRRMRNRLGLIPRGALLSSADAVEARVVAFISATPEDPEAPAARRAVVDWIRMTIRRQRKFLQLETAQTLNRFFWGYLERTAEYERFFDLRRGALPKPVPDPAASRRVWVGFAHGAPTLFALHAGTGTRRRGRGVMATLGINDAFWSVLAINRTGQRFARMALAHDASKGLDDATARELLELLQRPMLGLPGGPQFIVQRGTGPRMRLSLRLAREHGVSRFDAEAHDSVPVLKARRMGLFEIVDAAQLTEFEPTSPDGVWGTYIRLQWFLDPMPAAAKRHSEFFTHG